MWILSDKDFRPISSCRCSGRAHRGRPASHSLLCILSILGTFSSSSRKRLISCAGRNSRWPSCKIVGGWWIESFARSWSWWRSKLECRENGTSRIFNSLHRNFSCLRAGCLVIGNLTSISAESITLTTYLRTYYGCVILFWEDRFEIVCSMRAVGRSWTVIFCRRTTWRAAF